MIYAVNAEGIAGLRRVAVSIRTCADAVISATEAAGGALEDNKAGLGPHATSIQAIVESIAQEEAKLRECVEDLSEKLEDLAEGYQDIIDNDPYTRGGGASGGAAAAGGGSSGSGTSQGTAAYSGYTGRTEDIEITFTNPENGVRETVKTHRTIYENNGIDPNLEIPVGTKFANGQIVKEKTTNLELMRKGGAPFIKAKGKDGKVGLFPVELHHLDGTETHNGAEYFTGEKRDGGMVEIACVTHDIYDRILHIPGHGSFRVSKGKKKTRDAAKYEKYREAHWKERARRFEEMLQTRK